MTNHYPFDGGALAQLGALTGQKTIKALCGKRVTFRADACRSHVDCPDCRAALARKIADTRAMIADCDAQPLNTLTGLPLITAELRAACDGEIANLAAALSR